MKMGVRHSGMRWAIISLMDFATADYLSGIGQKVFIAELMPRFPVYMDLLPSAAQQVITQVHPRTLLPAAHVLKRKELRYQGYVDIFDLGPTEAEIKDLRAVQDSHVCKVRLVPEVQEGTIRYLVANDCYQHYRAILVSNQADHANLPLTAAQELRPWAYKRGSAFACCL